MIRFWIIAGLFVALGLGLFYAEWVVGSDERTAPPTGSRTPRPTATPTGPACACSSPGSASAGSPRPTRCSSAGPQVTVVDARDGDRASASGRRSCDILGADVRLGADAVGHRCPDGHRPRRHLAGLAPRPAAARGGRRGRHPGLGRGRAGLAAAAARGRGAVAHRDRHQRQDHDRADARVDPAGRRAARGGAPATSAPRCSRRCCTPSRTTCSPSSCPASSCTGRTRSAPQRLAPASTSRPTTSTGTARSTAYAAAKGQVYAEHRGRLRLQRARPAHRAAGRDADVVEGCRAIGFTLGIPGLSAWSASSTTCWSTGPSSSSGARPPPSWRTLADLQGDAPVPGAAQRRQRAGRGRAGPGARRAAGAVRDGLRAFVPEPHRIADVADGRRRALRRRLQGDQPARRRRVAGRVRARRLGGRRPAQGRRRRRPGQRARADRLRGVVLIGARPRAASPRRSRDTRRMSPSSRSPARTLGPWTVVVQPRPPLWRTPATSCCSRRRRVDGHVRRLRARGDAFAAAVHRHASRPRGAVGIVSSHDRHDAPGVQPAARQPGWRGALPLGERFDSPGDHLLPAARRDAACCVVIGLVMVLSASSA